MAQEVAEPTAQERARRHSIRYTRGTKSGAWAEAVERAIARLLRVSDTPHGPEYREIFDGVALANGGARTRSKRHDGARNTCALLCATIASADIVSGFVGVPLGEGQWLRKSWRDVGALSFGQPVAQIVSTRRTDRCARELVRLGFVTVQQWKVRERAGWRSKPGIKRITAHCWQTLGLVGAVKRERMRREREKREKQQARLAAMVRKPNGLQPVASSPPKLRIVESHTTPPHDPPPKPAGASADVATAHLAAIAAHFAAGEAK